MPKIDELRCIDKLSDAAVIGITELKLDNYILDSEFQINNYQIFRFDRNRKGGGVVCYVRNNLSYIEKSFFPEKIESIFFRVLLPKAKPTTDPKAISYKLCQTWYSQKKNYTFSVTTA